MNDFDKNQLPTIWKLISSTPPKRLFHYTNIHGIVGIIKSKILWATEARYLNDEKEIEHAKDYVQNCASNLRNYQYASQFSPDEKELLEVLENGAKATRPGVCVASFSEERDQLSQWRAYSGEGGYCLGLSGALLRDCAKDQGFIFGQCTYSHEECYRVATEILKRFIRLYRESNKSEDFMKQLEVRIAIDIAQYGPLLKHRSFAEEKEWRIITPQISIGDKRLDFRPSSGKILPFVSVNIENVLRRKGAEDGTIVIAGPGRDPNLASYAIQALTHREIGSVGLGRSDSPFRTSK